MKLLTKQLQDHLPKLYATEDVPSPEKVVVAKFFTPWTNWTWYAVEGEEDDGDFQFFGLVDGHELEWGYFSLQELESVRGPVGLTIERDLHFKPQKVEDITALQGRLS
ncbi:MAG: DUF2958 domain-containing protein [Chloroflexi bacterium]|nr:DUF2958 domain-containing protein [Chloroflexota bacterium]